MAAIVTPERVQNVDRFMEHFSPALAKRHANGEYPGWSTRATPASVSYAMRQAFIGGSYGHQGKAIADACKALGLKHTRRAMEAFFTTGAAIHA